MKKNFKLSKVILAGCVLISAVSCKKTENASSSIPNNANFKGSISNSLATGSWNRVFQDDFNNSSSLSNWELANRQDYNSSICNYQSANVSFGTYDSRNVLVITADKANGSYYSGHLKSNYSFKPGINQEYRVSTQIKLIALNGSNYTGFSSTYGAWPAFWTVQETNWPVQGEIDAMEGYSKAGSANFTSNLFYGTTANANLLGNTCTKAYNVSEGWHMYDEYWQNLNNVVTVTIQLDGVTVSTYSDSINGNLKLENFGPHNIMLNLCVGSNSNVGIFNNSLINLYTKTMMWVDYVTVDERSL
jgi:hypothetical protein